MKEKCIICGKIAGEDVTYNIKDIETNEILCPKCFLEKLKKEGKLIEKTCIVYYYKDAHETINIGNSEESGPYELIYKISEQTFTKNGESKYDLC